MKLTKRKSAYNKYERKSNFENNLTFKMTLEILDRDVSFRSPMSIKDAASEIVFGKSVERQDFEDSVEEFF